MAVKRLGLASLMLGMPDVATAQVAPSLQPGAAVDVAPPAAAVDTFTVINPDTAPDRSLGTIATRAGNVTIIDGGTLAGTNLFHSFAQFDLARGDVARWTHSAGDPVSITNVVNRVTGGNPSHLFGTIDSTALPNANFFFINPAGIVFGADSQVNVPAAAHFATASQLLFEDQTAFSVAAPDGSTLSVARPESFGFLGGEGAILISGAAISMTGGGDLSLMGSDVRVENSTIAGGSIILAATGGGPVVLDLHEVNDIPVSGRVEIVDSELLSIARRYRRGGSIEVAAGPLLIDRSELQTLADSEELTGDIVFSGTTIVVRDSLFESYGLGESSPAAIVIDGQQVSLIRTRIASEATGSGSAGVVGLSALGELALINSQISTDSLGSGDGGSILLSADTIRFQESFISADSLGSGNAGGIVIGARTIDLIRSYMNSDAYAGGAGGAVIAYADERLRLENSYISSDSRGSGSAGEIRVTTGNLDLANQSHISSDAYGDGDAGRVTVEARGLLSLADDSRIGSSTTGAGDAGGIFIQVGTAEIMSGSRVASEATGDGNGGTLSVNVAGLLRLDGGMISADVNGTGNGGSVLVAAERIQMSSASFISSDSGAAATGNAGDVSVVTDVLNMRTQSYITSNAHGDGNGGDVDLAVRRSLTMESGFISSRTDGSGDAGTVSIRGGDATMLESGIDSDAFGTGHAGSITLNLASLDMTRSRISSEAGSSGNSGVLDIGVRGALTLHNAEIATNTFGSGLAGDISINAGSLTLLDRSAISSVALETATGPSGSVEVHSGWLEVRQASRITTSSPNPNRAGNIALFADRLLVSGEDSQVSSENESPEGGGAGDIYVRSGGAVITDGGRITTNAVAGPAGNILLDMTPGSFLTLTGADAPGVLETSSGPGTGGLIIIASPFAIVTHGGSILALGQSGGANVVISTNYFISSADRLNRVEVDGDLVFENAIYDVSSGTLSPDLSVLDASAILRGQCPAIRSGGQLSQLSVRPVGPYGTRAAAAAPALAPPPEGCR